MRIVKNKIGRFEIFVLILFLLISSFLVINHEPWRDEAQAWLIARDSPTMGAVFSAMGYEGSPALWHTILFGLSHLGLPYFSMQIVHLLIGFLAAIIFMLYAPFNRINRALFIFGYFILYEYTVVARNYGISVLLLFCIAALYPLRFKRPIIYGLVLLLLINTNVHSFVLGGIISGVYLFEMVLSKDKKVPKKAWLFLIPVILGAGIAVLQLHSPPDLMTSWARWNLDLTAEHVGRIPGSVVGAFVPVPQMQIEFWNSKLIYSAGKIMAIFGLPLFLLSMLFFIRKPEGGLIYLISSTALLAIAFLKATGGARHNGFIYIMFIFSVWIASNYPESSIPGLRRIERFVSERGLSILFICLLVVQLIASIAPVYYEPQYAFSGSKDVARFLEDRNLVSNETFIASFPSNPASAILPYLYPNRKEFYYLEYEDYRSYITLNTQYENSLSLTNEEIMARIDRAAGGRGYKNIIVILGKEVKDDNFLGKYQLDASFNQTITESFYVYQRIGNV